MPAKRSMLVAVLAMTVVPITSASADRAPNPDERASIERALRDAGFTKWGEIESEDSDRRWEVDDAYAADGKKYDIELDAATLKVVKQEPD